LALSLLRKETIMTLKFSKIAGLLDVIKAYDFQPVRDGCGDLVREERYVVGRVRGISNGSKVTSLVGDVNESYDNRPGYAFYEICVIASSHGQYKLDESVFVPIETLADYDERVTLWEDCHESKWDFAIREQVQIDVEVNAEMIAYRAAS
jgi:hypothetical protein